MKIKKNYLLPHKNTNYAFVDGVLCGIVLAYIANMLHKDYRETKKWEMWSEEDEKHYSTPVTDYP